MSDDAGRPGLRQLSWIAAGVAVLTLLVVAASWLFSPRQSGNEGPVSRGPVTLKEEQVQKDTFNPESPGSRPAAPVAPAPLPETTVQKAPAPSAEAPAPRAPEVPGAAPETKVPPAGTPPPPGDLKPQAKTETVPPHVAAPPPAPGGFGVQVGAFTEQSKAKELAARLESLRYDAAILSRDGRFKVIAKGFPDRASAEKALEALSKAGIRDPFIVSLE